MSEPLFPLGQIVATPAALELLGQVGTEPITLIARHQSGDWGDVDAADRKENEFSVKNDLRILSSYKFADGRKVWIITEADRSSTCVLLPSDY